MLTFELPFLVLKQRAVEELTGQQDLNVSFTELDKSTMVYIRRCVGGKVVISCKVTKVILEETQNLELLVENPLITGNIELIGCSRVRLTLTAEVPVVSMERCQGCAVHLFREDPATADFKLTTSQSQATTIVEGELTQEVDQGSEAEQYMTRLISGEWLTEKIVHENGYQTTERERELNLAREERDEKKFGQAMLKGMKVSNGGSSRARRQFDDTSASFSGSRSAPTLPQSGFGDDIASFDRSRLNRTTTVEKTVGDMLGGQGKEQRQPVVSAELEEFHDSPEELLAKVKVLAAMIREAKYTVAFTGAGISHSAGLATYRGPNGAWTRRDQGLPPPKSVSLTAAQPTGAHLALVELIKRKLLGHVVSTNVDGLHRRSGVSLEELSELHGNCYKENCRACKKEFIRDFDTTAQGTREDHLTGRTCDSCQGPLYDNIINFGESLPEDEFSKADRNAEKGDLALVLGTSMKVSPACNIPDKIWKKPNGKLVIVNLQRTPFDRYAKLRIFGETDEVLALLMEELANRQ